LILNHKGKWTTNALSKIVFLLKKLAKASKSRPIKYSDKSAGQPEMSIIFQALKKILSVYVKGNYIVKEDKPGCYSVYYGKEIDLEGRKLPELCFATLLVQKGYVGFYYIPVYDNTALKQKLSPELVKRLKGKTCFHIEKNDPELFNQINDALCLGYEFYSSLGWN
jgi:hypothetical protein